MSKKLDVSKISNELRGRSLHFSRTPLSPAAAPSTPPTKEQPLELVTPQSVVQEQNVYKSTSQHVSEETNPQVNKQTSKHVYNETSGQVHKETSKQRNKPLRRFTTYLSDEAIFAMRKIAFETRRKDYEVFLEAVEKYIKRHSE